VQTLAELGLEKVARLNKKLSGIALLAKTPTSGYQTQKYHQGWYVTTHFNTPTAMKCCRMLEGSCGCQWMLN
jgi:hypothetical protein